MKKDHLSSTDFNLWHTIREETEAVAAAKPMLANFLRQTILRHQSLDSVLTYHLSSKLGSPIMDVRTLFEIYQQALSANTHISKCVEADLKAVRERDPACNEYLLPLLCFKGSHAVQAHRVSHQLYQSSRKTSVYFLQNHMSEVFSVDAHPAARFGHGLILDHAAGLVAGETAVLGNDISILRGVILGGSDKESDGRHPKIDDDVIIDTNASISGNIRIGKNAKIGAGNVVVADVPSSITAVGIPAEPVGHSSKTPSADVDQSIQLSSTDFVI